MKEHHWITLHRIKFPEPVAAMERSFLHPKGPECWRFAPSQVLGENGLPTWESDIWCAMGIFDNKSEADAFYADPLSAMPEFGEADEAWHALALPVQHRGQVDWRGTIESDCAIRPCADDPDGTLAIITSAGYADRTDPGIVPRVKRFAAKVSEAIEFLGQQPGNLRRGVFNGGYDGKEGFTLSLWDSDDAMLKAAYQPGHHRSLMDESRDGSLFDHSSFTRLRILDSKGSWSGDPLARAA